ncbi:TonB-dependent receptor [Scleromatobacter humisilvae]|uniref:TonB-dependent receptor n=1 Tax=Scleromatobacter humisilvae TaxID=2897159 RepID=A0A9X1YL11_9BURK|nr:TonB-dependent receptor [Scleromatobacter humisilvae]MCK9688509.1 TonB-dependent receptor [Scleromatobacter humisilvae]
MSKKKIVIAAGVASGLACLAPMTALAQAAATAASPAASTPSGGIATVIITAQKRKEDIRDVPMAVSALSGEQLQAQQITTVEDLTRNIPNISFSSQGGPGLGTVEIRGVSSQAGAATVSVYLDDVSLTTRNLYSQGTAEPRFFDLQDAEILRGPQGTLYGASSLGGTIKFISKRPDLKFFSGSTTETLSFTEKGGVNYEAQGVLNLPIISNRLGLRIGVEHGHESGYIDQVDGSGNKIAKDINHDDYTVVKLALRADLGAGWSVTPALFQQQTNTADIDATYSSLPRYETSKTVREPGHDLLSVPSVTVDGDLGFASFTGVLSGYKRRFNRIQDGTLINNLATSVTGADDPGSLTGSQLDLYNKLGALPSQVQLNNRIDQTSLELRLTSKDYDPKGGNPITWIAGAYAQDAKTSVYDNEPVLGAQAVFTSLGLDPLDPNVFGGFPGMLSIDDSYYSVRHYKDKQESVFGELTWHFSPQLALTGGLRRLHATQKFTREALPYLYDGPDPSTPGYGGQAPVDAGWNATTPSLKLNWEVAPDVSLYANASKGFRLGGANRPVPDTPKVEANQAKLGLTGPVPASFAPDSLWSYELGSKMDLADHRMTLNLAAFLLKWKNIQQDINLSDAGFDYETNVGNATSYGLEMELKARVTPSLTMSTSIGVTHATFDNAYSAFGTIPDGNPDAGGLNVRKGDWVEGVPRASASLGGDYHWALTDAMNAFVRGNVQWTGSSHGTFVRVDPDHLRASYFTADASAGVNWDKWEVTAFVKNLNNNHVEIQHPNVQSVSEAYYLRPRTIGMTANYEF